MTARQERGQVQVRSLGLHRGLPQEGWSPDAGASLTSLSQVYEGAESSEGSDMNLHLREAGGRRGS